MFLLQNPTKIEPRQNLQKVQKINGKYALPENAVNSEGMADVQSVIFRPGCVDSSWIHIE